MADPVLAYGTVAAPEALSTGTERPLALTNRRSLRVAHGEPVRMQGCRDRFSISGGVVANAVAPVADVGTTAAARAFYNGEAAGGKSIFIEKITARAASGTLGLGACLMVGLPETAQGTALTNATGTVGPKRFGGGSSSSLARLASGATLAGAPAWTAVAGVQHVAAVSVGAAIVWDADGMLEIPPMFALGITVHAPVGTTALFLFDIIWSEYLWTAYS